MAGAGSRHAEANQAHRRGHHPRRGRPVRVGRRAARVRACASIRAAPASTSSSGSATAGPGVSCSARTARSRASRPEPPRWPRSGASPVARTRLRSATGAAATRPLPALAELWLAEGCAGKKPSTLAMDRSRLAAHVLPLLGRIRVRALTRADVERFARDVAAGRTAREEAAQGAGGGSCAAVRVSRPARSGCSAPCSSSRPRAGCGPTTR